MKDLFMMGGSLFMSILTLELLAMLAWMTVFFTRFQSKNGLDKTLALRKMSIGKEIGLFALITGITGQLAGLYVAFSYLAEVGDVSPKVMFSGIKVSMITTFYGIIIYLASILLWIIFTSIIEKK